MTEGSDNVHDSSRQTKNYDLSSHKARFQSPSIASPRGRSQKVKIEIMGVDKPVPEYGSTVHLHLAADPDASGDEMVVAQVVDQPSQAVAHCVRQAERVG